MEMMKFKYLATFLLTALIALSISPMVHAEVFESTYDVTSTTSSTDWDFITEMLIGPGVAMHPGGSKLADTTNEQIGVFSNLVAKVVPEFTNGVIIATGNIASGPSCVNKLVGYDWLDEEGVQEGMNISSSDSDMDGYFAGDDELGDHAGIVLYIQPRHKTINIPFLMASEEFYRQSDDPAVTNKPSIAYYKNNSDKFAFFLKPLGDAASVTNAAGEIKAEFIGVDMKVNDTGDVAVDWWNIAQLPGGGDVEIATVNQHTNTEYFISNVCTNTDGSLKFPAEDINLPMEFNGAIVGPVAVADVDTNKIYKLKIAIADYHDNTINSVVFLREGGITSGADLKIELSGETSLPEPGSVTITDTVSNIGPAIADGVEVKHYLPEGVSTECVTITCDVGTCGAIQAAGGRNYFVWTIGDGFAPGSNAVLTVNCDMPLGVHTNLAYVATSTGDYDESNNTNELVTAVGSPKLIVTAIDTSKVYGETIDLDELEFILSIDGTNATQHVTGIDVSFTNSLGEVAYPTNANAAVGTYGICLSNIKGFDLSYFSGGITYVPGTLTITPATLNIKVDGDSDSKVYNGSLQTYVGTVTATSTDPGFDSSKFSYSGDKTASGTDVNTYNTALITASCAYSDTNYTPNWTTGTPVSLEITPATLNITVNGDSDSKVYNGSLQTYVGTVTATSTDPGFDASKFSYSGDKTASGTDVNTYNTALITASCAYSDTNYTPNWTIGTPVRLTITRKAITITANSAEKTYDGTALTDAGFTPVGHIPGDTFTVTMTPESTRTDFGFELNVIDTVNGENVAPYVAKDIGNYTITTIPGLLSVYAVKVTLTADSDAKLYDGTALTATGYTMSPGDALLPGDTFTIAMTADSTITNVGTQPNVIATVNGTPASSGFFLVGNYLVKVLPGTLTITPKAMDITVNGDSDSKVYNGSLQTYVGTVTATSTDPGFDASKFSYSGDKTASGTDVNTYNTALITASCAYSDTNYTPNWTIGNPVSLTITPATLNIKVDGDSDSKVYNGSLQTYVGTVTATSMDPGFDASKFSYGGDKTASGTDVNTYNTAMVTASCAYSDTNYTPNWTIGAPVSLTITPKAMDITVNGDSDSKVYNGSLQTYVGTVTATSTDPGFDLSKFSYSGDKTASGTDVNTYNTALITASCAYSDTNYTPNWTIGAPVSLTITPATLNIKVDGDSDSKVYNGSLQTYVGTVTATSTDPGFDASKFSYSGDKTASGTDVNTYNTALITASCAYSDTNYTPNWTIGAPVSLTITLAALTVTVNDVGWNVGSPRPANSFADFSAQLKGDDTVADITGPAIGIVYTNAVWNSSAVPTAADVGTYPNEIWIDLASFSGARQGNYSITINPGNLTVNVAGADLQITISNDKLDWNTGLLEFTLTIKNNGPAAVDPSYDYWVEIVPGPSASYGETFITNSYYIASNTAGTMPDGYCYQDITTMVINALKLVGNLDTVFDAGEQVDITGGIGMYHWQREKPSVFINTPNSFVVAGELFNAADTNHDFIISDEEKIAAGTMLGDNSEAYMDVTRINLLPYYHWNPATGRHEVLEEPEQEDPVQPSQEPIQPIQEPKD